MFVLNECDCEGLIAIDDISVQSGERNIRVHHGSRVSVPQSVVNVPFAATTKKSVADFKCFLTFLFDGGGEKQNSNGKQEKKGNINKRRRRARKTTNKPTVTTITRKG